MKVKMKKKKKKLKKHKNENESESKNKKYLVFHFLSHSREEAIVGQSSLSLT